MRKATLWEDRGITGYFPMPMAQKLRYIIVRASERKKSNIPDEGNGFYQCVLKIREALDAELKANGFKVAAAKKGKGNKDEVAKLTKQHEEDMAKLATKMSEDAIKLSELEATVKEQADELIELDTKLEEQATLIDERDEALATLNKAATKETK